MIMIAITIMAITTVHLYSAHIHYLPEMLYITIPKNYNFTPRNKKPKQLAKYLEKTRI